MRKVCLFSVSYQNIKGLSMTGIMKAIHIICLSVLFLSCAPSAEKVNNIYLVNNYSRLNCGDTMVNLTDKEEVDFVLRSLANHKNSEFYQINDADWHVSINFNTKSKIVFFGRSHVMYKLDNGYSVFKYGLTSFRDNKLGSFIEEKLNIGCEN